MENLVTLLTALVVISSLLIIGLVLIQPSKDAGLGGLSNTGVTSGSSVLGGGRNAFVSKLTWIFGIFIIISCLAIGTLQTKIQLKKATEDNSSLIDQIPDTDKEESNTKETAK